MHTLPLQTVELVVLKASVLYSSAVCCDGTVRVSEMFIAFIYVLFSHRHSVCFMSMLC
jgi:hypothetical protein